jgi:hypothetical protein
MALIGGAVVFISDLIVVSLGHISYHGVPFIIFGTQLFNALWGTAAGITFSNWLPRKFTWKLLYVFVGALVIMGLKYFPEHSGITIHSSEFNTIHGFGQNFISLLSFTWISKGFFYNRIHKEVTLRAPLKLECHGRPHYITHSIAKTTAWACQRWTFMHTWGKVCFITAQFIFDVYISCRTIFG